MNYWLMKSEPSVFGIDDLRRSPGRRTCWDGVRNYQARNMIRDHMRVGDQALFYHSSTEVTGVAGIMEIVRAGYPDPSAFEPDDPHYDPDSDPAAPRWFAVDVKFKEKFGHIVTLAELKHHRALAGMQLLKRGNRLSVMPVSASHWRLIQDLAHGR
jgi:predicted RNA-binding protein with PUA-like domain